MFNSKLFAYGLKSHCDWFGKQYKETNLHSLPQITKNTKNSTYQESIHSCKY